MKFSLDDLPNHTVSRLSRLVSADMTAANLGNPTPAFVLATPVVLQLFEECAARVVLPYLGPEFLILGVEATISHSRPTPTGLTIEVEAELVERQGNKLKFALKAWDAFEVVAYGSLTSAVVSRDDFESRFREKFNYPPANSATDGSAPHNG